MWASANLVDTTCEQLAAQLTPPLEIAQSDESHRLRLEAILQAQFMSGATVEIFGSAGSGLKVTSVGPGDERPGDVDLCITAPHCQHINQVLAEARVSAAQLEVDHPETIADLMAAIERADEEEGQATSALKAAIKRLKQLEMWRDSEMRSNAEPVGNTAATPEPMRVAFDTAAVKVEVLREKVLKSQQAAGDARRAYDAVLSSGARIWEQVRSEIIPCPPPFPI